MNIKIKRKTNGLYIFEDEKKQYGICFPVSSDLVLNKEQRFTCEITENSIILLLDITNNKILGSEIFSCNYYPSTLDEINDKLKELKRLKGSI